GTRSFLHFLYLLVWVNRFFPFSVDPDRKVCRGECLSGQSCISFYAVIRYPVPESKGRKIERVDHIAAATSGSALLRTDGRSVVFCLPAL
ncbi:MAG: hypothetical protein R6V46_07845, partial [Desulfatiglandaceae bacterium]